MDGGRFRSCTPGCSLLTYIRHLMTGIGAYYYIVWAIWLRHCLNERQDEFALKWPSIWSIPEVISVAETHQSKTVAWADGYTNGQAKGRGHRKINSNGHRYGSREDRKSV